MDTENQIKITDGVADASFDTDVAIVGYGPSGVSAANFLASRGVKAIVLERAQGIYPRARAVTINDWTMRCYQSVGLSDELKTVMEEPFCVRVMTFAGQELRRNVSGYGNLGFPLTYSIYQPAMEEKLRAGADRYPELLSIRFGKDVVDLAQDADGVTLSIRDLASGQASKLRARYVLACDGGSSTIRERLGIPLLGNTGETRWVVIDSRVKRWWPNRHMITLWSDSKRPVVDIALAMGNHRWELPLEDHESESDFDNAEALWRLLATMGVTRDDVEIHQHAFYKHHVRHAERWRDGRVILVGDAAHLMPPWAGQGMQSGVRDAFNISWKLAGILDGSLPASILDTYQPERAPNVEYYTRLSVELGRVMKQEFTDEEKQAMQRHTGEPPPSLPVVSPEIVTGWVVGDTGSDSIVGKFVPQPLVATTNGRLNLLDDVIGNGFVLLGAEIDPRALLNDEQRRGWDGVGASYRAIRPGDKHSEAVDDIIDIGGTLLAWMKVYGARCIAVRPDRFVAAADTSSLSVPGQDNSMPLNAKRLTRNEPGTVY